MAEHIARNDAPVIQQVTTLTPVVENSEDYAISINTKVSSVYTSDASATAAEIVEGLNTLLIDSTLPEYTELTFEEDNSIITVTGNDSGQPFTIVDASGAPAELTVANTVTAQSKNHWIAKNFSSGTLPASTDTVTLTKLDQDQGFLYDLNQSAVTLALLEIRADSRAQIGLPETNTDGSSPYYQAGYRETFLKISSTVVRIGEGSGEGSRLIKLNLGTNATDVTVFSGSTNRINNNETPIQLLGSHASNTLQVIGGEVDVCMLPNVTGTWATVTCTGGTTRFGRGTTLTTVTVAGNAIVETRSAVTTINVRDTGRLIHTGSGNIGTLHVAGDVVEIKATSALTITTLNGYGDKVLDLSNCDSDVTITNMNIYANPGSPFTIRDPNNKLVMTNAASVKNGAQSLLVITGNDRNVKVS